MRGRRFSADLPLSCVADVGFSFGEFQNCSTSNARATEDTQKVWTSVLIDCIAISSYIEMARPFTILVVNTPHHSIKD